MVKDRESSQKIDVRRGSEVGIRNGDVVGCPRALQRILLTIDPA